MVEQVVVTSDIEAPAERVWALVSDLTRMGEWSPEAEGVTWIGGTSGPGAGARFRGTNRHGTKKWQTVGTIVGWEPGHLLTFRITAAGFKVAEWRYTIEARPAGCRVTETWTDQRGRIAKALGKPVSGVEDRSTHNRATMEKTLERLKSVAETAVSS